MYLVYDTNGNITSIDTSRPGDFFNFIEVDDVPVDVQKNFKVVDGILSQREQPFIQEYHYAINRLNEYHVHEQLARLSDDISAGLFGEAAKSGSFMAMINGIKNKYPKR